jgi:quinol monooxygenase YgiN
VRATPASIEEAKRLCLDHVERSRREAGCLHHAIHVDVEDPCHLLFVEEWESIEAVRAHFAVPASMEFIGNMADLDVEPADVHLYEVERVSL